MKLSLQRNYKKTFKRISGWGKTKAVSVEILSPKNTEEIKNIINHARPQSIIARGKGRSYGDAAQIKDGKILKLNHFHFMLA